MAVYDADKLQLRSIQWFHSFHSSGPNVAKVSGRSVDVVLDHTGEMGLLVIRSRPRDAVLR